MIDLGVLTWTQQWEFWLFSRILRPVEFGALWRWDYLFVPDQVWLLVGAFRAVKTLMATPGTLWVKMLSLGGLMRSDPILFLSFGLLFVAEPHLRHRRQLALIERAGDAALEAGDLDAVIAEEEDAREGRMNEEYAREIENAQSGNSAVLPASVLSSCRCCRNDRVVATNLLVKCGHFPYCDACVNTSGFACTLCSGKGIPVSTSEAVGMTSPDLAKPPTVVQLGSNVSVHRSCGVCQEREGLLSLMPCGHLLFCGPCVLSFKLRCPYCRERITRAMRGFDVRHSELAPSVK